ncbi:methionine adenosyltransferase regulatory beta subunit [Tieghemostelium lacteum]|uniref:Methionine adenosyltransferase regulatory beta subunit n=1 Tax=Tieghemostelium lacteum TaxID=361077 RepID=A0A151Z7E4_TIELA|nr:methionine adenosyltransferase regulatory beta subunit [Tieghemostelium lacteum]|eukprot:KYQ89881.1 methionine adenosyltransferase regulatory beta subunit [Tieghemostelium lacteum]
MILYRNHLFALRMISKLQLPKIIQNLIKHFYKDLKENEFYHGLFERYHGESSQYMKSDIDLFFISDNLEHCNIKFQQVANDLVDKISNVSKDGYTFAKTEKAITIVSSYPYRPIQLITLVSRSVEELVSFYDLDCVRNAFDGNMVYVSQKSINSINKRLNILNERHENFLDKRMMKYHFRGYPTILMKSIKHRYNIYGKNLCVPELYASGYVVIEYGSGVKCSDMVRHYTFESPFSKPISLDLNEIYSIESLVYRWKSLNLSELSPYCSSKCFLCGRTTHYIDKTLDKLLVSDFRCRLCAQKINLFPDLIPNILVDHKVALVSGGRSQLGLQFITRLLNSGYHVISTTRYPYLLASKVMDQIGQETPQSRQFSIYQVDFSKIQQTQHFIDRIKNDFPNIDLIVLNSINRTPLSNNQLNQMNSETKSKWRNFENFRFVYSEFESNQTMMVIDKNDSDEFTTIQNVNLISPLMMVSQLTSKMPSGGESKIIYPMSLISSTPDDTSILTFNSIKLSLSTYLESIQNFYKTQSIKIYIMNLSLKEIKSTKTNSFVKPCLADDQINFAILPLTYPALPTGIIDYDLINLGEIVTNVNLFMPNTLIFMKLKILLTGASGLLGRAYLRALKSTSDIEYLGLAFSRFDKYKDQYNLVKCDLNDRGELKKVVEKFQPNVIIHCAAERKPDICENDKDKTFQLNVDATEHLSKLAIEFNSYLFLLSTDYVFDGKQPPYQCDSVTSPLSYYGVTKRESEVVALKSNDCNVILRVPILYGQVENLKESAVIVMTEQVLQAKSGTPVQIDNWQIRYPTLVDDVAKCSLQLIRIKSMGSEQYKEVSGIFHFSSDHQTTKYKMSLDIGGILSLSSKQLSLITPTDSQPSGAPRPHNAQLDISQTKSLLSKYNEILNISSFSTELSKCLMDLNLQ